jgi:peptide/nickel transport system substrate-binding protein
MKLWLALALVACNPPDGGPKWRTAGATVPRAGGTLRFATKDQVRTLDPTIDYDEVSSYPVHALFETLVDYAPSVRDDPASGLALQPHLAERWDVSTDARTYRFVLRDGITYSDGTPIVAADFVYSLERALTTADSPFGAFLVDIDGAQDVLDHKAEHCRGIVAPSDHELVITLAKPNAAFIDILTMSFSTPQRRDHVARAGDQIRRSPLGSGPFVLETWDEGRRLVLRANPRYWDRARIHLDAIELLENIPRDTQFLMFQRGELDTAERLSAPDYLWVIAQRDWEPYVQRRAVMNAYGSRMNVRMKPFDDRRVRQALNYALDKQHSLKLLNGAAVASHGILPPGLFGRDDSIPPYPHDPAKARRLLAEAGYPDGFDTDYVVMNDDEAERLATSLQGDLAEVGVRVHLELMSFSTYVTAVGSETGPAFSKATWVGDYPDPTNFLDARFHSRMIAAENSNNDSFYANPELDALLDAARGEPDPQKRAEMYHRAERILYDDAPWIWEYHQLMTEVVQPYVRGYSLHPIWLRDYSSAWLDVGADGKPVPR